mmetsp:Transcript_76578/g.177683  ORF Transcript_76578/g.177683 Transcript_76578/m.177683 type:complete len:263 (-) Transcript_76578:65-853(-)
MAHATFVTRACDGLILAETRDQRGRTPLQVQHQALQLLGRLHTMSPRCSLEVASGMAFHLIICDGVCYLGLFDYVYPKALAFKFLEEVCDVFREELKREFGTGSVDHRSHIETIEKPYHFIRFDRQILKKQMEFGDPTSSKALTKLQGGVVHSSHVVGHINDILLPAAPCKGACVATPVEQEPSSCRLLITMAMICLTTLIPAPTALTASGLAQVWTHSMIALSGLAFGVSALVYSRLKTSRPKRGSDDVLFHVSDVSDCIL